MGKTKSLLQLVLTGATLLFLTGAVHAAGEELDLTKEKTKTEQSKDTKKASEKKECPKGTSFVEASKSCVCDDKSKIWSAKTKQCVAKTAEILTDEDLYRNAVVLTKAKQYKVALDLLWRIKKQNQPRVLNYIGFNNRKLGKIDKGISYYNKALAINADFHRARQYLGEGYLQKGDLKGAQNQLSELGKRCGMNCEYYKTLSQQITDFKAKQA